MDIELINLVLTIAILVITIEFNLEHLNRRITNWEISINRALSSLAKANKKYHTITLEEEQKEAYIIKEQWDDVKSLRIKLEHSNLITLCLPILLTIEVGHIALQFFRWSWFYEWILPGLNKVFLIAIIVIILIFFIIRVTLGDKKISKYETYNSEIISKYEFDMQ